MIYIITIDQYLSNYFSLSKVIILSYLWYMNFMCNATFTMLSYDGVFLFFSLKKLK